MALFQSRHGSAIKLSPSEMLTIDDQIMRDYRLIFSSRTARKSPQLKLSARELLSISDEISRDYAVQKLQYSPPPNQSEIVLLPVDTEHLHAYWHLDDKQRGLQKTQSLTLRIHGVSEQSHDSEQGRSSFDIAIETGTTQQQVTVPATMTGNYFSAELGCLQHESHFSVLASSDMTFIPRSQTIVQELSTIANKAHTASGLGKYAS